MALADSGPAPYAPSKAVLALLHQYREKTLPTPFTPTGVERAGVERSLAGRTLTTMRLLDLVDDSGNPTDAMKAIKVAPSDQYQSVLAEWVREQYKPIFSYTEPSDVGKVMDQFRHYEPSGMRNRMMTLFLGLCVEAGLIDKVPPIPRGKSHAPMFPGTKPKPKPSPKRPEHGHVAQPPRQPPLPEAPTGGMEGARARYVDLLMEKAAGQADAPADLLDRIERALGIVGGDRGAPP